MWTAPQGVWSLCVYRLCCLRMCTLCAVWACVPSELCECVCVCVYCLHCVCVPPVLCGHVCVVCVSVLCELVPSVLCGHVCFVWACVLFVLCVCVCVVWACGLHGCETGSLIVVSKGLAGRCQRKTMTQRVRLTEMCRWRQGKQARGVGVETERFDPEGCGRRQMTFSSHHEDTLNSAFHPW